MGTIQMCPRTILPSEDADLNPVGFYARSRREVLAIELTLAILALFSVLSHVYEAFTKGGRPSRRNNFFLVVAGILALAHTCLTLSFLDSSAGSLLKVAFVKAIIDPLIILAAQLSLVSIYLRWLPAKLKRRSGRYRLLIKCLIVFCVCSAVVWIVYPSVFCSKSWGSWSTLEKPEVCQNMYGGKETRMLVGTIAYVAIALAPIPMIWRSTLSLRQKVEVISIMFLGLLPLNLFLTRMLTLLKCEYSVFWVIYSDIYSVAEFSTAIMIVAMVHSRPMWLRSQAPEEPQRHIGIGDEDSNAAAPVRLPTTRGDRASVSSGHVAASMAMANSASRHGASQC